MGLDSSFIMFNCKVRRRTDYSRKMVEWALTIAKGAYLYAELGDGATPKATQFMDVITNL